MPRRTLSFRLIASSFVWVAGSLLATGVLLVLLFRNHIERRFDARLRDHIEELVAASEVGPDGRFELTWTPSDPRYNRPLSGWYWQIRRRDELVARSASLWHKGLEGLAAPAPGSQVQEFPGPDGRPLRALVERIELPDAGDPFLFAVAGPELDVERDVARFRFQLAITMGILGLGLVSAVLFQVRFGLRPLRLLERALAEIRAGARDRLPETFPAEVHPVVRELNTLLDEKIALLERYRTQTANLAHALKNPMTVIGNEIRDLEGERGAVLKDQAALVSKLIDRHLSRARVAASGASLGARAPLAEALENLRFSMSRLHRDRELDLVVEGTSTLWFRGDAEDLEEMLGNLIDNACKWARRRVVVRGRRVDARLRVEIEDDGPGIPPERCEEVLTHGRRLDSRVPGSGLGLGIVQDVAELYGGSLRLARSPLGGLSAELELPAVD